MIRPRLQSITIYGRYVDDSIIIGHPEAISNIRDDLNNFDPRLHFTIENEANRTLNFLDITVTRTNQKLELGIYRKPMASGRYIHQKSAHPPSQKIGLIKGFYKRALKICNTAKSLSDENQCIVDTMNSKGYNPDDLHDIFFDVLAEMFSRHNRDDDVTQPKENSLNPSQCIIISYTNEHNRRTMNSIIANTELRIIYRPIGKIQDFFPKFKDTPEQHGSIYGVNCNTCNELYIGETPSLYE